VMKIFLLFYMCDFAVGLTHCYKTTVFFTFIIVNDHNSLTSTLTNQSLMSLLNIFAETIMKKIIFVCRKLQAFTGSQLLKKRPRIRLCICDLASASSDQSTV